MSELTPCIERLNELVHVQLREFPPTIQLSALATVLGAGLKVMIEDGEISAAEASRTLATLERMVFPLRQRNTEVP